MMIEISNSFLWNLHRYHIFLVKYWYGYQVDGDLTFNEPDKKKDRWAKIKSKIKIDLDLGRNKIT